MKKILFLLLMFAPAFINFAGAQQPAVMMSDKSGWHKIGETTADFKAEKDELVVLGKDAFRSIKIKITDAPIHIADLEVYYESGDNESISLKSDFKAGGESRVIDLKGDTRAIKKVVFVYNTVANSKNDKAHVELYGLK
ncbi:hypothetical protein BH11BAC1_BH11BAC1_02870 [soil metagenome]